MNTELQAFDGLDNRKELIILLQRLGSNERRAQFIVGLASASQAGFAGCPLQVQHSAGCDPVTAYMMLIAMCNEIGVSIGYAARRLEEEVKKPCSTPSFMQSATASARLA